MASAVIAVTLIVVVAAIALVLRRHIRPAPPTQPTQHGWAAPRQLDRGDFTRPDAAWLVVVFSSATCASCVDMMRKAGVLASSSVAVQEVEAGAQSALHHRYAIEAVPITVVADHAGVVRASFIGPASATDLWAAVAEARQPGSSPEPGLGR